MRPRVVAGASSSSIPFPRVQVQILRRQGWEALQPYKGEHNTPELTPPHTESSLAVEAPTEAVEIGPQLPPGFEPVILPLHPPKKTGKKHPKKHPRRRKGPPPPRKDKPPMDSFATLEAKEDPRDVAGGAHAACSGKEVLVQGFNWDSHKQKWYTQLTEDAALFTDIGATMVWLPPPSPSVSREGYMPTDLYSLNSHYGSEAELQRCVGALHAAGLKVLADLVLNHRCASKQDSNGVWNHFTCSLGKLDWGPDAIIANDPHFAGTGIKSNRDIFHAAPNIAHGEPRVRAGITEWMVWLKEHVGFDGWRFDFVRGIEGGFIGDYIAATQPSFVVGEYWDSLAYDGSEAHYDQDAHRQRTVEWIKATGGRATAFDVTTKGILHAAFERQEFWRLKDADGRPPGLIGWWPSHATTFVENHDTGSSQGHWRFPGEALTAGYAYILTHPGTPTLFYDHVVDPELAVVLRQLVTIRRRNGLHAASGVEILAAEESVYAARIDHKLCVKIGPGHWCAEEQEQDYWEPALKGHLWTVWQLRQPAPET